jgi:hypothetical protein
MLILAHLDSHRNPNANTILAHQRLGDRATMEQVLENMELVAKQNEDVLSDKSAVLLRRLLQIEADAAQGITYNTTSIEKLDHNHEHDDKVLQISMGYLGIIRIAPDGISCDGLPHVRTLDMPDSIDGDARNSSEWVRIANHKFPGFSAGLNHSANNLGPFTNHSDYDYFPPQSVEQSQALPETVQQQPFDPANNMQQPSVPPNLAAGMDEWAFQGVDTAFFGSMIRGASVLAGDGAFSAEWTSDWNGGLGES